jgi:1-acyl-sn-glycerol-3-phosphate acyltransferase
MDHPVSRMDPVAMRFAHRWVGPPFLRRVRVEVTGRERVPRSGGFVLAANHRSFLDHFLLSAATPRPPRFLGKDGLARGFSGRFNLAMGMVPVSRGTADTAALDLVIQMLRDGAVLALFPEGTRSPTAALYRFRSGLARIVAEAAVPCLPVGLVGTADVWPRGERPSFHRPAPGTLAVHFGDPMPPPDLSPRARRDFTAQVRQRVAALSGQPLADSFAPIAPSA